MCVRPGSVGTGTKNQQQGACTSQTWLRFEEIGAAWHEDSLSIAYSWPKNQSTLGVRGFPALI